MSLPMWTKIGYLPSHLATPICIHLYNSNGIHS
ncbi:hypothetical protein F383_31023 [Gossypium arboreum]|uniref:Uncharacterized protein n=1 Tax=Gossypium arboreum TaxID=29729 RepID=A0A0B0N1C2_GOSAR|nr:hypothetical protein F383_31023 [Gossypium arboreum]